MKFILQNACSRLKWAVAALLPAALLFASGGSAEGAVVPGDAEGAVNPVNQTVITIAIHGPSVLSVHENTAVGTFLATYNIVFSDSALAPRFEFTYSLEGGDSGKYRIDASSGELFTAAWLDFETDASDTMTIVASDGAIRVTLDVTVNVEDLNDSVSILWVSKANPVPGANQGNPGHALNDSYPDNFVSAEWANWGTVLRIDARRETPDPNCGTGLDCVRIGFRSDVHGIELEAMRRGERGIDYVTAVMLVEEGFTDEETVEITGANGEVWQVPVLAVNEDDYVSISYDRVWVSMEVENTPPEFSGMEFEQDMDSDWVEVELVFEITDADSGLPEPEDLPDTDGDEDYMPVVGLIHDSQCYGSRGSSESLNAAEGISLKSGAIDGTIYCDGMPGVYHIVDDRDFVDLGWDYRVETTIALEQGSTHYITFVACDKAGNCSVYDADDDSDALMLRIDALEGTEDSDCVVTLTGDITIDGEWDGACPSGREPESYGQSGDRYARYYTFTLGAASDVTITLTSSEDTYLYLLEGAGEDGPEILENDDIIPFQDLNSRIEATLQPGEYTIEATPYHSQMTGEFTLVVEGIGQPQSGETCSSGIAVPNPKDNAGLVSDCEALLSSRDALAGEAHLNWSADIPMEEWDGVSISGSAERVINIDLSLSGLTGAIPPELSALNLKGLFLSHNELTGLIPAELSHITYLEYLELDHNQLTGAIPQELTNLTWLRALYIADNQLSGCIPDALRDVQENDLAELGLPYCDESDVVSPPLPDACVSFIESFETRLEIIDDYWEEQCESVSRFDDYGEYYARYFTFDLLVEADVTITLESDKDAYLYLLEGDGERGAVLYEDDDSEGTNSRIRTTLQPGSYTVEATTYEIGVTGDFRFGVETEELDARPPVTCVEPLPEISSGSSFSIEFAMNDGLAVCESVNRPKDGDYYADYFALSLKFPAYVTITLESDEDGYLFLLEGDGVTGEVLYENDDSIGTNPVIQAMLQPGVYTIEATTYHEGIIGDYRLEVGVMSTAGELCLNGQAVHDPANNQALLSDCAVLLDAKYILEAEPQLNWSADLPMKEWEGVRLGGSPLRVAGLHISGRGLNGEVPDELDYLMGLQVLELTNNALTGRIPYLANLKNLELISLGYNNLSGEIPSDFDDLSALKFLNLHNNKLSGEIPPEIGNLENLLLLTLRRNRLNGGIPSDLGRLVSLEHLDVGHNRLTGDITSELRNLSKLRGLDLGGNRFTGEIPNWVGELSDLKYLALYENKFWGELPYNLTHLSKLVILLFYTNSGLCAPKDAAFQTWLQSVEVVHGVDCFGESEHDDRPFEGGVDLGGYLHRASAQTE